MTRVLFLDVDGVLNYRALFKARFDGPRLCSKAVARLRQVIARTGAQTVLSSTWRLDNAHMALMRAGGFPCPHEDWRTIQVPVRFENGLVVFEPPYRGREIAEWLSRHPEVERYAIVDDDDDMLPEQLPYFVKTSFDDGLLSEHVERLVELLSP